MAYARPDLLAAGDLVPAAHFKRLRGNWIAYEDHDHTVADNGATLTIFSPIYGQVFLGVAAEPMP